jgi:hypothetical protein
LFLKGLFEFVGLTMTNVFVLARLKRVGFMWGVIGSGRKPGLAFRNSNTMGRLTTYFQ